jgi:hypothetical protein
LRLASLLSRRGRSRWRVIGRPMSGCTYRNAFRLGTFLWKLPARNGSLAALRLVADGEPARRDTAGWQTLHRHLFSAGTSRAALLPPGGKPGMVPKVLTEAAVGPQRVCMLNRICKGIDVPKLQNKKHKQKRPRTGQALVAGWL